MNQEGGGRGSFKSTSQEFCFGHVKLEMLINSQVKIQRRPMDILNILIGPPFVSKIFSIFFTWQILFMVHILKVVELNFDYNSLK